jgi:ferric-chelate reductase
VFESHPFTITNAPPAFLAKAGLDAPRGITLYAKECGGWTGRLRRLAEAGAVVVVDDDDDEEKDALVKRDDEVSAGCNSVKVVIDGPYGGLTLDVDKFGVMLLVAGGSGITFMLGCIEECLRKGANGGGPRRIEAVWVVRDMGG